MSSGSCGVFEQVARGSLAAAATFSHGDHWDGDPDEEVFERPTAIFTTAGTWTIHGRHERVAADEGVVVLGHRDESYGCSHPAGSIDRTFCVTFLGDYELPGRGSLPRRAPLDGIIVALRRCDSPLRVDALALTLLAELHELRTDTPRIDVHRRRLETAFAVGFRSRGHLARVFRARTGVYPSRFV